MSGTPLSVCDALERPLRLCGAAAGALFLFMLLLTFADVFLRYFLSKPLDGTVELTSLSMALVVLLYTGYAQWHKTHVVMDIFILRLKDKNRHMLNAATHTWSAAIVGLGAVTMFRYGLDNPKTSPILGIPLAPVIFICAGGVAFLCLALLKDGLQAFVHLRSSASGTRICLTLLLALLPIFAAYHANSPPPAGGSSVILGILGIVLLFILFFLGMPVAFALMSVGFIFVCMLRGDGAGLTMFGKTWWNTVSNYTWAPLMSFMFMGYACYYCGFGANLYRLGRAWMGHLRGGLAMGGVAACTLFGAVVGDVLAGSIAMAAIALPEMRRAGYSDQLAVGSLACSGTIGALIPPSTTFILYGVLAEQSISDLFAAGILPGILCTLLFMAAIRALLIWRPQDAPPLPKAETQERLASLSGGLPIVALFVLVIGGIYGGLFTPTEGGAVGACGTLILGLCMGRLSLRGLRKILEDSSRFTAMCFTLLGGAATLSYFMTMSRIPAKLASSIAAMQVDPMLVLVTIVLLICFLGCFLPAIPLILICVPIFVPIAKVFHWNLIWFGVLVAVLNNMASITPPFGISLFVMKSIAGVPLGLMYRAALPFILALGICLTLLVAFPEISLFLPETLKNR
ncbi:MAG: TRAP transporter large permease subunit [Deltaproteobacteria bacterium]|jgi:tripartite ATP-independent transporter DctM subunit|nr:TRAP transporter large permease subunit [Deltaproteobacteria bacterium]